MSKLTHRKILSFIFHTLYFKRIYTYRNLKKWHVQSKPEIEQRKFERIKELVTYSYENVPYYHDLFEKFGIVKNGILAMNSFQDGKYFCITS